VTGLALLALAVVEFLLIGLSFLTASLGGAGFNDGGGLFEFCNAFFAARDLGGNAQAVLERGAVGVLGFGEEFGDLVFEDLHLLNGVSVTDSSVFAGVGEDLGAVDGDGDVSNPEDF
jgi:hypothetical protein